MTVKNTLAASVSRDFSASAECVFDAWLDPQMVTHWFAPGLGEMTRIEINAQPGGAFYLDQRRGDEIARHWGEYRELERPQRLVFTWCVEGMDAEDLVSIDITPKNSGCSVTITHTMDAAFAEYQELTKRGWRTMMDGLAKGLDVAAAGQPKLIMTRRFNATPDQVFKAWTDQALMRQWLFTSPESESNHCECDPRPGGRWSITNRREGIDYTASGEYLAVEAPRRLVFTFAMPQFSPNSDQITVLCERENDDCLMTFIQEGTDIAEELRQLPEGEPGGSESGWQAMFNHLAGALVRSRGHGEKIGTDTLRFERLLPGPIEKVWSWLTASDKRGQWFASGEMPNQVGESFVIRFEHASLSPDKVPTPDRFKAFEEGVDSNHTLTCYEPHHRLAMTWGGGDEALSEVRFELFEEGEKVRLVLTHQRLAGSEQAGTAGGWHTHLAILEFKLSGITPPSFWTLFHGIEQDYQQRLSSP